MPQNDDHNEKPDPNLKPKTISYKTYQIVITPTGNEQKPFTLHINGKNIGIRFVVSRKKFYSHLFYQSFISLEELAKNFIDVNPDLSDPHPHHPQGNEGHI